MKYTELNPSIVRRTPQKNQPTGDTELADDISEEEHEHTIKSNMIQEKMSKVKALLDGVKKQRAAADCSVYTRLLRRAAAKSQKVTLLNTEELSLLNSLRGASESPVSSPSTPSSTPLDFDMTPIETTPESYIRRQQNSINHQNLTINTSTTRGSIATYKKKEEKFSFEEAFGKAHRNDMNNTDKVEAQLNTLDEELSSIKFAGSNEQHYFFGDDSSPAEVVSSQDLFPEQPLQSLEQSLEENNKLFPEQPFPENLLSSKKNEEKKHLKSRSSPTFDTDDVYQIFPKESFPDDDWTTEQRQIDWTEKKEVQQGGSLTNKTTKKDKKSAIQNNTLSANNKQKSPSLDDDKPRLVCDLDWEDGKGEYTGVAVMAGGVLVAHGRGKLVFVDGDIYIGPFRFGCMHGSGATYRGADGGEYFGGYKQNRKHGFGEEKFVSGSRYVGQYRNNLPNGFGIQYSGEEDDDAVYCGDWKNGVPVGIEKHKLSGKVVASDDFLDICPDVTFVAPPTIDEELPKFKSKLKQECHKLTRTNTNDGGQDTSIQSDETKIHVNTIVRDTDRKSPSPPLSSSNVSSAEESSTLSDYEVSRYNPAHDELMAMEETKRRDSSPTSFRAMESLLSDESS